MDPLSVLREFSVAKQLEQVMVDDGRVKFGERYSFPKTVSTGYKRHGGGAYDLNTLVFLLKQPANYAWLNYVRSAREANIPQVAFPDRKELFDYLTGVTDKSDKIQLIAPELVLPMAVDTTAAEASSMRARQDTDDAMGLDRVPDAAPAPLQGMERQLRDRNSQMAVPGKSFKQVLEILHMAQRDQATWRAQSKPKPLQPPPKEKRVIPHVPSDRFNRPAEQKPKGAFKIDSLAAAPGPPPLPPGPPPEGPSAPPPPPPLSSKAPAAPRPAYQQKQPARPSGGTTSKSLPQRPIIIVPAAPSAKITMLNVKPFLEKGHFIPSEAARKDGVKKEAKLIIHRRLGRPAPVAYEVTDRAPPKKSHDWRRVVAAFVTGAAWQFKDWPYKGADKGEMAETFHHVLGVHVSLKNEQSAEAVRHWNVQRFQLHPVERHGDQPVVMEIYAAIDRFMAKRQKAGIKALELLY